jgi:phosphoribosyl 1,2-cyclic phosphodiesterase
MQVVIWGCRGSLPTPMPKAEYDQRTRGILEAYRDAGSPEDIDTFIAARPFADCSTYGGNTACIEVTEGDHQIIFDSGSGIRPLGLKMMGGPCGKGQGDVHIIMSHTHWDHIMGFPFFVPAFIPGNKVTVYGCHPNIRERFEHQQVFTHFPVLLDQMASTKTFVQVDASKKWEIGPFRISSIPQYHPGDSFGFRVETDSGSFVYATDAEYTETTWDERQKHIEFFHGADVLIFDAAYSLVEAVEKLDWGHSSPFIGVEMANDADVKNLVLFHHDPTASHVKIDEALHKARRFYDEMPNKNSHCNVVTAYDSMTFDLG